MSDLPEYETCPPSLASRTGLKKAGLVPTGDPVASLRYRTPNGYRTCPLFSRTDTRSEKDAKAALKRRQANAGGQFLLIPFTPEQT
ncbi:hypothetical protein [Deinococcus radiotolerans]|uniref:Uncharacterized protein n=1 Tax=Deinococcus radiotolerans TaxID=1309407 RepID=A0ABQ2FQD1_9DEIO|nr:hypothetical protein [Deinococcus radiotolerans]GGL16561.1 hypothetical protein GCM10010844_39320 [Deinococcus radiotolerans]